MNVKKIIVIGMMLICAGCMITGCKKGRTEVSTEHGEDYQDGRQKKWTLRKSDDTPVAEIRVTEGYILSDQSYFSCQINSSAGDKETEVALVEGEPGLSMDDAVNLVKAENEDSDVKVSRKNDYTLLNINAGDGTHENYLVMAGGNNALVIRLINYPKSGSGEDGDKRISDILSMITVN